MVKTFRYDDVPVLETTSGKLKGYFYDGAYIFKGVPYAHADRFQMPAPARWEGVKDATSYGFVCPLMVQDTPSAELMVPHRYWPMDEHCQNLNIWTTELNKDAGKPVLVWLHGGGYFAGSSIEQAAYDGRNMCVDGDVVVVSVNHRLNILGYLDLSEFGSEYANSGNAGGDDIVLALRWVRENIASFGGDADNVTVFGQSGGGAKVTTLLQTPAADGLYHRGIIMSGVIGPVLADSTGSARECAGAMMAELGVDSVAELETIPYVRLAEAYNKVSPALKAQGKSVGGTPTPNRFYLGDPMANGSGFRPETGKVPLMVGTVFAEFLGFMSGCAAPVADLLGEAAEELLPLFHAAYPGRPDGDLLALDTIFRAPSIDYIRARAAAGGDVYSYLFEQDFPIEGRTVAWHCADIPFFFHNTELVPVCHFDGAAALEERIFQAVMRFARSGGPGWPASTPEAEQTMLFGPADRLAVNFDHQLIRTLQPLSMTLMERMRGARIQH